MLWIIIIAVVIAIAVILYLAFISLESAVLFQPEKKHEWKPPSGCIDVTFGKNKLNGWLFEKKQERKTIVLFCHGNTGNVSSRKDVIELFETLGLSLFIFDYQGYGKSGGTPSIQGLYDDGEDAYTFVRQRGYEDREIIIWGESLGGIVAIDIASRHECFRLLLLATFSDFASLAWEQGGMKGMLAYPFLQMQGLSNIEKIRRVKIPTYIIHSGEDELIPYHHGERLYNALQHDWKRLVKISGSHGKPRIDKKFVSSMMAFSWWNTEIPPECEPLLERVAS